MRQSHMKHERLVNNLIDTFLYRHDVKGVFNYVSSSITQILGYSPEEFLTSFDDFMTDHPSNLEGVKHTKQSIQGIQQLPYEIQLYHKDCSLKWLEVSESPVRDNNGKVVAVEGVAHDITERKWAEERLKESERRTRAWLENSPVCTKIIDLDSNLQYMSRAGVVGLRIDDVTEYYGKAFPLDFFPGPAKKTVTKCLETVRDTGEIVTDDYCVVDLEGNELCFHGTFVPVINDEGQIDYIIVVSTDTTERKRAEEERERNRYYLKRAQEIGRLGTWEMDIEKNKLVWTDENYRIFGIEPSTELTYEKFMECVYPDDREFLNVEWNQAITNNQPYDIEHRILVGNQVKWVREKAELDFNDEGRCVRGTGFTQDITDRKQAEKQRETLVKSLEYKNRELQDIVYTASHDLRSPLVNIEGFSAELEADWDHLLDYLIEQAAGFDKSEQITPLIKEDIPECLRFISSGAKKMSSLLDGLLQVSRIGTVKIHSESLDMEKIVREILDAMAHQIKENNITVTLDWLPCCKGDLHMLDHVFTNLLSNAIKYRDPAKECKITISGKVDGGMSVYCVEDNGVGIAAGHQEKVFEIFHRLNPQSSVSGEGLGLTIVTRVMDRLGGKIWVESEPGKGSKFFIALPHSCPR